MTGSGDYAGAANGGTATGTTDITKNIDWSYGTTSVQAWDAGAASAAGAWATVSKTSENSYSALDATSSSGSGNYSWSLSPSGTVTQNANSVLAQSYTDGSTMNAAGSYGYHGSGLATNTTTSELTYGGDNTYTDPGTFDSRGPEYYSHTGHYNESGGKSDGSTVSTDWTMDSSGTWQAAKTTQHREGDTSGTYVANYAEHRFWNVELSHDMSGATYGPSSSTYQDTTTSSAEKFNYSYTGDTTVAGGTTSGTASGDGSASGECYRRWLWSYGDGGGGTADYSYSGGWSGMGASQTTSGVNTATIAALDDAGNTTDTSVYSQSTPGFPTYYAHGAWPAGFRDSTVNDYRYGASQATTGPVGGDPGTIPPAGAAKPTAPSDTGFCDDLWFYTKRTLVKLAGTPRAIKDGIEAAATFAIVDIPGGLGAYSDSFYNENSVLVRYKLEHGLDTYPITHDLKEWGQDAWSGDPDRMNSAFAGAGQVFLTSAAGMKLAARPSVGRPPLVEAGEKAVARQGAAKMAAVREAGRAGEAAAGINAPKKGFPGPISGKMRFPDALTRTALTEVKNVARQGWTAQLKDFAAIAKMKGVDFELWVRQNTILSKVLEAARDAGEVIIKFLPPGL